MNKKSKLKNMHKEAIIDSRETARIDYEMAKKAYLISGYNLPSAPTKQGYWKINVSDPTKKSGRKQLTAKSLEELKEKLYNWERGIDKPKTCDRTIREVFDLTQKRKLNYVKSEEKRYSVMNTVARNTSAYKRFVSGTDFENMLITDVRRKHLDVFFRMNLERYDLKIKGLASLKAIIKPIFDMAYREEWISDNPYTKVDFKELEKMLIPDAPIEERCHSDNEIERMLDFIHDRQGVRKGFFAPYALELQIIMGLRRGEVPALMWSDIDNSCVTIQREVLAVRGMDKSETYKIVHHTKTHMNRKFPITKELGFFLVKLKSVHKKWGLDSPYLFPADNENGCISVRAVYTFYSMMCKELGIVSDLQMGPHSFRRTRITEVINKSGGNLIMATKLFGNSPRVAEKHYYTGLDLEQARKVLDG